MFFKITFILFAGILYLNPKAHAFVPKTLLDTVFKEANALLSSETKSPFGLVSETLTHEEIIKRGIIRSAAKFFYDQPGGKERINLNKMEDYYNIRRLYNDFYDQWFCNIELIELIEDVFQKNVINIDFDSETKDLPIGNLCF